MSDLASVRFEMGNGIQIVWDTSRRVWGAGRLVVEIILACSSIVTATISGYHSYHANSSALYWLWIAYGIAVVGIVILVLSQFVAQKEIQKLTEDSESANRTHTAELDAIRNSTESAKSSQLDTQTNQLEKFSQRVDALQQKLAPGKGQPRYTIDPNFKIPADVLAELNSLEKEVNDFLLQSDRSWFRALRVCPDICDGGQTHQQLVELSIIRNKIKAGHARIADARKSLGL